MLTLGRLAPMWILWINTFMSNELPVFGSTVCGWWHMMHSAVPTRDPPWNEIKEWQELQSASRTTDRKSTRLNSSHLGISYAVFFLNDTATTEIYTLSLHDALPILMHSAVPTRDPPWNEIKEWQELQSASRTTSRGVGVPPAGTKSNVAVAL